MLCENILTPIAVECDKMYRSKVCVQQFSYFVSGLDIQLEQSENDSPARKVAKYNDLYTVFLRATDTNGNEPMAQWLRLVAESWATWVQFLISAEFLCSPSAILRGTEPVRALTRALFILLLS